MRYIPDSGQQEPAQLFFDLIVPQFLCPLPGHDDQVNGRQVRAVAAKKFPQQAFYPIPLHRLPQAFGHHQPQPWTCRGRRRQGHAEMARV